jgi:hypothetical protein
MDIDYQVGNVEETVRRSQRSYPGAGLGDCCINYAVSRPDRVLPAHGTCARILAGGETAG